MGDGKPRPEASEKHNQLITDSLTWAAIAADILVFPGSGQLARYTTKAMESKQFPDLGWLELGWVDNLSKRTRELAQPSVEQGQLESIFRHSIKDPKELEQIQDDMAKFEARAKKDHLSAEEVGQTYFHIARLLTTGDDAVIDKSMRALLARQILHLSAQPFSLDQGNHNTCGPSALSARLYARNPQEVARVIADIAISKDGTFTTLSGRKVTIDKASLKPDSEAAHTQTPDGKRSYANQILQLALVNTHWTGRDAYVKDGRQYKGPITYRQLHGVTKTDSGERLIDSAGTVIDDAPSIAHYEMSKLYQEFSQQRTGPFIIVDKSIQPPGAERTELVIGSPEDLRRIIQEQQHSNNMPLVILVDPYQPPWSQDKAISTTANGNTSQQTPDLADEPEIENVVRQGNVVPSREDTDQVNIRPGIAPTSTKLPPHMVNITDFHFDKSTGTWMAEISNQWGKASDISVDLDSLYRTLARRRG